MNEMKIRINNPAHSKQVQEALFWLGYHWYVHGRVVMYEAMPSVYTERDGSILFSSRDKHDINYFYENSEQEYELIDGEFVAVFKGNV